jgi:hypothetical protein
MSNAKLNRELPEWLASIFKQVDWPIPPYLRIGFLSSLAKAIEAAAPKLRSQIMREHLAQAYGPEYLAAMLLERYSKDRIHSRFHTADRRINKGLFCRI